MPKILVTLKDPDAMYDAVREHVDDELSRSELPKDEQDALKEVRVEKYKDIIDNWFKYGEYVTLEFDTDTKTARILTDEEANGNE